MTLVDYSSLLASGISTAVSPFLFSEHLHELVHRIWQEARTHSVDDFLGVCQFLCRPATAPR
jgi:hypothetical protein